jgi:dTDP-4-amino-4,6-dideoxygalactose transaminase
MIPLVDLKTQYKNIQNEIQTNLEKVFKSGVFIRGPIVEKFEEAFGKSVECKHCIGVGNGTDALYISLRILGIGPGDEVITTAHSWISTSETITQTGATPVFVDTDKFNTLDHTKLQNYISKKTRAIVVVHLYGQPAQMDFITTFAKQNGINLIEDCAQAHYAKFNDKFVGSFGDIATYSFFPSKNLGAYGDAGAITTNNYNLSEKIRAFANHGQKKKNEHEFEGINSRLDEIQASVLLAKLSYINEWTEKRVYIAEQYSKLLESQNIVETPKVRANTRHVFHLYVIKTLYRDELKAWLNQHNIATGIHYPYILPDMPPYRDLCQDPEEFLHSRKSVQTALSLPIYPELSSSYIKKIVKSINEFADRKS